MGYLRINKIIYSGNKYYFESKEFTENIVLIEGDNGTGKSTFCNLIYYGLGGEVESFRRSSTNKHVQITSDTNNYVDLFITISGKSYILKRIIDDNDITVIPYEKKEREKKDTNNELINLNIEQAKIYPINRHKNNFTFSDWILEQLEISVVELFYGYTTFKVNFVDLMRLIYHDQQPNPEKIYKNIDNKSTLVSDSELLRKAIFELLVGKSYSKYYDSIVEEKKLAKERELAKNLVNEYKTLIDNLRNGLEPVNITFLQTAIQQREEQLEKLHNTRSLFKANRSTSETINSNITNYKDIIIQNEFLLSENKEKLMNTLDERYKLSILKLEVDNEIIQIKKIIFSHDQLNLFTADTCPYCLNNVERSHNHCVCGAEIKEEQYERFFYTSLEYKEILKSKIKSLETIKLAYDSCNKEINDIQKSISELENSLQISKDNLLSILKEIDEPIDLVSINDIDDKILDIRENISNLMQQLDIESKLKGYQDEYDKINTLHKTAELNRKAFEIDAQKDIINKVKDFSVIYNKLMTSTLPDCRSAKITLNDYMPIINDGEYKEASSSVSTRLMYYITLMQLSLQNNDVSFPRFLLVDTPETAGIEKDHLMNCLSKFQDLDKQQKTYQVILSTGLGKYPASLAKYRVLYMPDKKKEHMLLKERTN